MMTRYKREVVVDQGGTDRTIDQIIISGGETRYKADNGTVYDSNDITSKVAGAHTTV